MNKTNKYYSILTLTTDSSLALRSFSLNGRHRTTTNILLLLTHCGLASALSFLLLFAIRIPKKNSIGKTNEVNNTLYNN